MSEKPATVREYDVTTPEVLADPTAWLHRVREESPVAWLPRFGGYLLTRHADVVSVLQDTRLDTANMMRAMEALTPEQREELTPLREAVTLWVGHTNPTDHRRFQLLLKKYFTPRMVDRLRPRVREITHDLLDAVAGKGSMEVIRDLAYPLPANVIAEMLGMPVADRERLQAWSRDVLIVFGQSGDLAALRRCQDSMMEFHDYLRGLAAQRRAEPREDVLSMFVAAQADGIVTEDEALANCVLLLFAGHETTANLIANGLVLLFQNPDVLAALRADPEQMPMAVEEMLRLDGPAGAIQRKVVEPVEVGGHLLPAGAHVFVSLAAANRDPAVFPDPDRFDVSRGRSRHMAFGTGTYYCLGASLARMEADECFRILLDRMPALRPAYDRPDFVPAPPVSHRLASLEVLF
ncbi:cytochrome P450 [Catenuloplanes japonicus]|uniref:cytochrome P450 n=1 Tax=Catenuloplanes japonicus TaxID=33876 RepID=UPI000524BFA5|nr:cytochrome P450 [Catenuloplanes japonicus]